MLPTPDREDLFLKELPSHLECKEDPQDYVKSLIQLAINAKRPRLAGLLFTHLPNQNETDPTVQRAQQTLRLILIDAPQVPSDEYWNEVQEQWTQIEFTKPGHRLRSRHHPRAQQNPRNQFGSRSWRRR